MGFQYFYGSGTEFPVKEPMPQTLMVKAPASGKNGFVKVETDTLTLWIDKQGARISKADVDGEAFFNTDATGYLDTQAGFSGDASLNFSTAKNKYKMDGDKLTVSFSATDSKGMEYQKRFEFEKGEYTVNVVSSVLNRSDKTVNVQSYYVIGGDKLSKKEKSAPSAKSLSFDTNLGQSLTVRDYSGISYTAFKNPYVRMKFNYMDESKTEKTKGGWLAFQKHHFIAAWVFDKDSTFRINNFWREGLSPKDKEQYEQQFATQAVSNAVALAPGKKTSQAAKLYIGPQSLPKLMAIDPSLRLTMDYGFFWMVANGLHKALRGIHGFVPNWSISLFLLVGIIRAIMYRSMKQQAEHVAKMRALEPEKQIIEKRFENDTWNPERIEALSALYKKHGLSGFKPSLFAPLLQIPLMLAFFNMVQVAVEFRGESFLWVPDLSLRDPYYILPVIASMLMVLHFTGQKDTGLGEEVKIVFRIMPFVMLFISVKWPAVTCLYLILNTLFFVIQDRFLFNKN